MDVPDDFLWGAATAAHQVEGGLENDWTHWEREHAEELAADAATRFGDVPVWEDVRDEATDPANYVSGDAVDFRTRYNADVVRAADLGCTTFRFSLEWSRIEPEPGRFDADALDHYQDVVDTVRAEGMEPMVTLWHFTNPQWFADRGGWSTGDAVEHYARYVDEAVEALDGVRYWVPLNEPVGYTLHAPLKGDWPAAETGKRAAARAGHRFIDAQEAAYDSIHDAVDDAQVGSANNVTYFEPVHDSRINRALARLFEELEYGYFLRNTLEHQDFIGVNHYLHRQVDWRNRSPHTFAENDLGWAVSPDSLERAVTRMDRFGKPIIVTEHGCADRGDRVRSTYLEESLDGLQRAIERGVDVKGYVHWSLLDNHEWDKGRWPRFGLYAVDYDTMERNPRTGAETYRAIIQDS